MGARGPPISDPSLLPLHPHMLTTVTSLWAPRAPYQLPCAGHRATTTSPRQGQTQPSLSRTGAGGMKSQPVVEPSWVDRGQPHGCSWSRQALLLRCEEWAHSAGTSEQLWTVSGGTGLIKRMGLGQGGPIVEQTQWVVGGAQRQGDPVVDSSPPGTRIPQCPQDLPSPTDGSPQVPRFQSPAGFPLPLPALPPMLVGQGATCRGGAAEVGLGVLNQGRCTQAAEAPSSL